MNSINCLIVLLVVIGASAMSPKDTNKIGSPRREMIMMNSMKPTDWFSMNELKSLPNTIEEITMQTLESMPMEEGEQLLQKMYHLSQINHALMPTYVPSPSNVPVYFAKPNGQFEETNLSGLVDKVIKEQPQSEQMKFGNNEVTILITGLPESSPIVEKANKQLVAAFMERNYGKKYSNKYDRESENDEQKKNKVNKEMNSSYESEDSNESSEMQQGTWKRGDLVIIDLGNTLKDMKRYTQLDIEQTGEMFGKMLVDLTNQADIPHEIIYLIGQGMGAHVAGAAARQFKRLTGHRLRRITALDPARWYANDKHMMTGLARGDADFVDAIHTNTHGLGTRQRVGDVDFYVNGPGAQVPGAENVVEASMRATRYFAESVRPGMERSFPAVPANSLRQYEAKDGMGKRAYMGIATKYDLKGDYILDVNAKSPFGKRTPAKKQRTYHAMHKAMRAGVAVGMGADVEQQKKKGFEYLYN